MIQRNLKNHIWSFDETNKILKLTNKIDGKTFIMNKTRFFSLFRFLIRVSERMIIRRRKVEAKEEIGETETGNKT